MAVCYGGSGSLTIGLDPTDGTILRLFAPDGRLVSEIAPTVTNPPSPLNSVSTFVTRAAARENVLYYVSTSISSSSSSLFRSTSSSVDAIGLAGVSGTKPSFNGAIKGLIPQADGSVLIWGSFNSGVARLKADLSLDSWTAPGLPSGTVLGAEAGPGGTIFVAMEREVTGGLQVEIVRLLGNGLADPAFTRVSLPQFIGRYSDPFSRLWVKPDGAVTVILRSAVTVSAPTAPLTSALLRFDTTGNIDEAWSRRAANLGTVNLFPLSGSDGALIAPPVAETDASGNRLHPQLRSLVPDGGAGAVLADALRVGTVGAFAVRSDGAAMVDRGALLLYGLGPYTKINGAPWTKAALLREDGSRDPEFGFETAVSEGGPLLNSNGSTFRFDHSDRLLVSGAFTSFNGFVRAGFARLNADGTTDQNFIPEFPSDFRLGGWSERPDGRTFAVSAYLNIAPSRGVASLFADGRAEPVAASVAEGLSVFASSVLPDGAVLLTGQYYSFLGGGKDLPLARLTTQNLFDVAYAPQITGNVRKIFALPDGKAMVTGFFTAVNGTARTGFARLNADGSLDPAFVPDSGITGRIEALATQPDGKLLVVTSNFTDYAAPVRARLVRLADDGSLDSAFQPSDTEGQIRGLAVLSDGRIEIMGDFSSVNGQPRFGLARLLPGAGPVPPSQPIALRATQISANAIHLRWDDSQRETGYRIERRDAGQTMWTPIGSVGANLTAFIDSSASRDAQYRIVALGADGESHPSAVAAPAAPATPRNVTATAISPGAIRLTWSDVAGETGYLIEVPSTIFSEFERWDELARVGADVVSYTDARLTLGETRGYRVSSFNVTGNSRPAAPVSATAWRATFPAGGGRWSGIATPTGAFEHARSGLVALDLDRLGRFTGVFFVGAKRLPVRGSFSAEGNATGAIAALPGIADAFALSIDPRTGAGTGRLLLGGNEQATMNLVQAGVWNAATPCPHRGAYTLLLPRADSETNAPAGIGFARATVRGDGSIEFAGMLADGTFFSQGARLSADGRWPFFARLDEGAGALLGWMKSGTDGKLLPPDGTVRWTKPLRPRAAIHREAFSIALNPAGARYTPRAPVWTPPSEMLLGFSGSDLAALPATVPVIFGRANAAVFPAGSFVTMNVSPQTGLFVGTFIPPAAKSATRFRGAILQPDFRGGGCFRGSAKSGAVSLEPRSTGGNTGGGVIVIGR